MIVNRESLYQSNNIVRCHDLPAFIPCAHPYGLGMNAQKAFDPT